MNLPNSLTLSRIFLVPPVVTVLLTEMPNWEVVAAALILIAAVTDLLDGYLARRQNQVTTLGILLDPIADKLLVSSAFIALVQIRIVPAWMVVIIVGREFAVTGLRNIAAAEGFTIDASNLGKWKMAFQVVAITLLILGGKMGGMVQTLGQVALWAVVVFALLSMIQYFRRFWGQIDESIKHRERRRLRLLRRRLKYSSEPRKVAD